MAADDVPVLVGAGQILQEEEDPRQALAPMSLAAAAAREALDDTGRTDAVLRRIDTVAVMRLFSDSTPRRSHEHGRATNPPRAVARKLGARPKTAIYAEVGGNTPQKYVNVMFDRIARGDAEVVLLAGAEAIRTERAATRAGIRLDWHEEDEGDLVDRGFGETLVSAHELAHGIGLPIATYPLFEQAIRNRLDRGLAAHMAEVGRLMARFNQVARTNPVAAFREPRSAHELTTPGRNNPYIAFPYPRLVNARDGVDQGAALVLTSERVAAELGIDPDRFVYLHGAADLNEKLLLLERVDYARSPAIELAVQRALEMAEVSLRDVELFDLYSCFPSAVEIARDAIGIPPDDPRPLTLTGGLPFFGGPGNNYTMHAICEMVSRLREQPGSFGLVTANGGYLSKHSVGVYSGKPAGRAWHRPDPEADQTAIDAAPSPPVNERPSGSARLETSTVTFSRAGPERGIVIGLLEATGERFVANTPPDDGRALERLMQDDGARLTGTVRHRDGRNVFLPDR